MSEVIWLPEAVEDLKRLRDFLTDKNPDAAKRAAQTILNGAKTLAEFPEIGRPMNDGTERRELFEAFGSGGYVLRYILDDKTVVIIRVWHSKEARKH
jgi:plasmid stabilization system protein ParE